MVKREQDVGLVHGPARVGRRTKDLTKRLRPGDVAMVKGSNGSKASLVATALAALDYSARESA